MGELIMKKLFGLLSALCLLFVACGGSHDAGSGQSTGGTSSKLEPTFEDGALWDWAAVANDGTVAQTGDGTYTVTLTGTAGTVLGFTNSPYTQSIQVQTENLFHMWGHMFEGMIPNAVVVYQIPGSETKTEFSFQMTNPSYDPETDTLTFDATLLSDSPVPGGTLEDVTLFIDPTAGQWVGIVFWCGATLLQAIAQIAEPELIPELLESTYGTGCQCCKAIVNGWHLNYGCPGC
jgi:hypothetical protein